MESELQSLRIDRAQKMPARASHRRLRRACLVLALSVLVGALLFAYLRLTAPTEVQVYPRKQLVDMATSGTDSVVLYATGYLVAAHKIEVASKVPGRVAWIGVEKGDKVKEGQVLVRLEDQEYRAQLLQAQGNFSSLRAKLDELEHGSRPQEIARARAEFESAKADLKNDEIALRRTQLLATAGVLAQQNLDDAQAKYDAQAGKVASLEQSYALEKLGPRQEEIAAMRAQLGQANGTLAYARTQLDGTIIRAPVTGTILDRNVEKGEFVTTGFVGERGAKGYVVSLADLSELQVELDIDQSNFAKLTLAQRAAITTDAYPDRNYAGRIVEIAPEADRQKATVQIKVKIENPDQFLRPDMNASVSFEEEPKSASEKSRRTAQVVIPQSAVRDSSVFVLLNGRATQRKVVLGGSSTAGVRVLSGLTGGEDIIVNPPAGLKDGDRVRRRERR